MSTTPKRYTRFELMDTTGRVVVHCGNTQSLEQDECRTLKVFIDQPARVKDAELIQMLVDALNDSCDDLRGLLNVISPMDGHMINMSVEVYQDALDIATAAGFKPSKP